MVFEVYCDGSTRGNGQENSVGAWAYVILKDGEKDIAQCGSERETTNQRMELAAAINALHYLFMNEICVPFDKVIIYTDSAYLYNCYVQSWYKNWQMNGWKNAKKQPVANQDLWEELIKYFEYPEVQFVKVKGHAGNKWNEYVDTLAQTAAEKRRLEEEKLGNSNN